MNKSLTCPPVIRVIMWVIVMATCLQAGATDTSDIVEVFGIRYKYNGNNAVALGYTPEWTDRAPTLVFPRYVSFGDVRAEVTEIGSNAFAGENIVTLDGNNITRIDDSSFANCTELSTLLLPKIETIGSKAFMGCNSITNVDVPTLTSIGESAFKQCSNLENINMPNVETIGRWGFKDCSSLKTLSIPKVTFIHQDVFSGCTSISGTPDLSSAETIYDGAFYRCTSIQRLELPKCKSIYYVSFSECSALETVNAPILERCGNNGRSFFKCTSLRSFIAPNIIFLGTGTFKGDTQLEYIEFPHLEEVQGEVFAFSGLKECSFPSLTEMGSAVFNGCINLEKVELAALTTLGPGTFGNCPKLSTVILPNLEKITGGFGGENSCFYNCPSLKEIYLPKVKSIETGFYNSGIVKISAPLCEDLLGGAFSGASELTELDLPSVKTIGNSAFSNCVSLKEINFPGVTSVGHIAFDGCSSLVNVSLPNLTSIGSYVFRDCKSLVKVHSPKAKFSEGFLFYNCESLTTIDGEITAIDTNMFYNCKSIKNITVHGDTEIKSSAFSGCSSLETLTINGKIRRMDDNAFFGCSSLKELRFENFDEYLKNRRYTTQIWPSPLEPYDDATHPFDVYIDGKIKTNAVLYDHLDIGPSIFSKWASLEWVHLGDSETNWIIDKKAFKDAISLKEVYLGKGLSEIREYAFKGCNSLESVSVPDSCWKIEHYAFSDCSALERFSFRPFIPAGSSNPTNYSWTMLENCSNLQSIILKEGSTFFDISTLRPYLKSLKTLSVPKTVKELTSLRGSALASNFDMIFWGEAPVTGSAEYNYQTLQTITLYCRKEYEEQFKNHHALKYCNIKTLDDKEGIIEIGDDFATGKMPPIRIPIVIGEVVFGDGLKFRIDLIPEGEEEPCKVFYFRSDGTIENPVMTRADVPSADGTALDSATTGLSFPIEGLDPETRYTYRVNYLDMDNNVMFSSEGNFQTPQGLPTGVDEVSSPDTEAVSYYTLDGIMLPGRPSRPGVYITVTPTGASRKIQIR